MGQQAVRGSGFVRRDGSEQRWDPGIPLRTWVQDHQAHLGAKQGWFCPSDRRKELSGGTCFGLSLCPCTALQAHLSWQ